jgi:hypothetical protein
MLVKEPTPLKRRFQFEKLEERIAPSGCYNPCGERHEHQHKPDCDSQSFSASVSVKIDVSLSLNGGKCG